MNQVSRALVFDLDGTLIHSLPDLAVSINALLGELNRPNLSEESIGHMVGDGASLLVERALTATGGCPCDITPFRTRFTTLYLSQATILSHPYPMMEETLTHLKNQGWSLAVCTNKPGDIARSMLQKMGLDSLFQIIIGGGDTPTLKPDPAPIHAILQSLNIAPCNAIMVGDTENDVKAAQNAGLKSILVAFGYGKGDLTLLGANAIISDFSHLPTAVAQIMTR